MYLSGLGTAVPEACYTQAECWQALKRSAPFQDLQPRSQGLLRKVLLGDNGISTRHLALDGLQEAFDLDPDSLQRRFETHAPKLAATAGRRALSNSGLRPEQIDAVVVSTCTGYMCPGLSGYVAETLGLPRQVQNLDLVGQGCGAALPNASVAKALLDSSQAQQVLCVCVEVCSAAMYLDDDPGVLISACLFADGAAAAVWSSSPPPAKRRVEWIGTSARLSPDHREELRFEHSRGCLRNILRPTVPAIAASEVEAVFEELLRNCNMQRSAINGWIMHAGGRNVLRAVAERLELNEASLHDSSSILESYGNLSSPFVYFVLERAMRKRTLMDGHWFFCAFGAGFSCQGALLRVGTTDQ